MLKNQETAYQMKNPVLKAIPSVLNVLAAAAAAVILVIFTDNYFFAVMAFFAIFSIGKLIIVLAKRKNTSPEQRKAEKIDPYEAVRIMQMSAQTKMDSKGSL